MAEKSSGRIAVFAGTYAAAEAEGIGMFEWDAETESWTKAGGAGGLANPSFLALHPKLNVLFAASETAEGAVAAYRYDWRERTMTEINRQPTKGADPCHIGVDRTGRWLLGVNYSGGSVFAFPIGADGEIGEMSDFHAHEGSGVRADRQEAPHPHSIFAVPGTDDWLVSDLGTDKLYVYRLDAQTGKLTLRGAAEVAPGAGPRHAAFHPELPLVYSVEELSSAVSVWRYRADDGSLSLLQTTTTLPADFAGENTCADIHLNASGTRVYASNRGHDSIAVFRVAADGTLEAQGQVPCGGRMPRNFAVVGNDWLFAANQDSGSIVAFRLDEQGIPVPVGSQIEIAKPVCLKIANL